MRLDLNWPANDDVTNGGTSVNRQKNLAVQHLVSHRVANVSAVMIAGRLHCAMYLHYYHMCVVVAAVNGSVDFVNQPTIVLEVIDRR